MDRLGALNDEYFAKNNFIFLICATGKTIEEMILAMETRLPNSAEDELVIAAGEQEKITQIRISKLFSLPFPKL